MYERDEKVGVEKRNGGESRGECNHLLFLQLHQQGLSALADQVYPRCSGDVLHDQSVHAQLPLMSDEYTYCCAFFTRWTLRTRVTLS